VQIDRILGIEGAEPPPTCGLQPRSVARLTAKRVYRARIERFRHLGEDLFADPAWDMLLDLFICQGVRRLSVSAVCLGAQVPHATAMRYLRLILDRGLAERLPDVLDRRRTHVRLTAKGVSAMEIALERFAS